MPVFFGEGRSRGPSFSSFRGRVTVLAVFIGVLLAYTGSAAGTKVVVSDDGASARIQGCDTPVRTIALRDGLLPTVHYLPDGRHALMATRTGWVFRLDLERGQLVDEVRVAQVVRETALSGSHMRGSRLLAVANALPTTLVILDEFLQPVKSLDIFDKTGKNASSIASIQTSDARDSFIATLMAVPEMWELSYNPMAPEIGLGLVHDFQYREGQFVPGYLNPQRTTLPSPAPVFLLDPSGHEVVTAHPAIDAVDGDDGEKARLVVTHLDTRRPVAQIGLPAWPDLANAAQSKQADPQHLIIPMPGRNLWGYINAHTWVLSGVVDQGASGAMVSGAEHSLATPSACKN